MCVYSLNKGTAHVPGIHEGEKSLSALALEIQMAVCQHVGSEN